MALRDNLPLPTLAFAGMTCAVASYTSIKLNYGEGVAECVCAATLTANGEPVEGIAEVRLDAAALTWDVDEYTVIPLSRVVLRPVDAGYEIEFALPLAAVEAMLG